MQALALAQIVGLSTLATVALVALGLAVDAPPAGSIKLTEAELCPEDGPCSRVSLPVRIAAEPGADHARARLLIEIPAVAWEGPQALYFPDYADALGVAIGGRTIARLQEGPPGVINRNRPALFTLPEDSLGSGPLELQISVAGYPQFGARLGIIWIGPRASLAAAYEARYWLTAGLAQAIFLVLCGLSVAFVWLAWVRRGTIQLGVATASVSAATFSAFFAFAEPPLPVGLWTLIWDGAIRLYSVAAAIFLLRLVEVRATRFEVGYAVFMATMIIALAVTPPHLYEATFHLTHTLSIVPAVIFVVIFWSNRHRLSALNTQALMVLFAFMIATGVSQLFIDEASALGTVITQLMPLLMLALGSWVMMGQLVGAVRQYEALTETLHAQVAAKSAELEATYAELAKRRRVEAIAEERERIMMDLHDGVGGQLVNALTYLQSGGDDRALLRATLDACLADLSLTVDSLEAEDSVTTLLAMLRARLAPVFDAKKVELDWTVEAEPVLPEAGASAGLHVLRIVQEALTNAIKHAGARRVSVQVSANAIEIVDDGRGLIGPPREGGIGLRAMAKRADAIGARIAVEDTGAGTRIRVLWEPAPTPS
ncbi:MAG: ATP-binding protein [Pseudomonadota bacterium]